MLNFEIKGNILTLKVIYCKEFLKYNKTTAAACIIIISGMPIIKRLCRVLCLIVSIVIYITKLPPKMESKNRVLSFTRHLPFIARNLSAAHTITETRLIAIKYIKMYLLSKIITDIILTALNRLFNLFFKLNDNSFFKS